MRLPNLRSALALVLALAAGPAKAAAGVYLSSYTFAADNLPYIWTDEPLAAPYRLRAKIAGSFHATSQFNNNGARLESVPGPGTFMVELYWVLYASDRSTVLAVGPFRTATLEVQASNHPPMANGVSAPAASPGQSIALTGSASDPDGNLQWLHFFTNDPTWSGYVHAGSAYVGNTPAATASVSWQVPPSASPGTYQVHLRASDATGSYDGNGGASASFEIRLAQPPVSSQNATVPLGGSFRPAFLGGAGMGPWQFVVVNQTNWGGIQPGTLLPPNYTPAAAWTANLAGTFSFYIVRQGDGVYFASNIAGPYTLTVPIAPPVIAVQPQSLAVSAGQGATFSVVAGGTGPFTYQWRKNGTPIAGATTSSLSFPLVQFGDAANAPGYSIVVSNAAGSVASAAAALTVAAPPPIRLALQYWLADDWPDYRLSEHVEEVWVNTRWVVDEYDEYGNPVSGHEVWDPHWETQVIPEIAADGQFGSRWDTTVARYDHPLAGATGAFNPAVTDRGFLLPARAQNTTLAIRAWAYAPGNNCSSFTVAIRFPQSGLVHEGSIPPASCHDWKGILWETGIYRIDLTYSGALGAAQPSGTVSYWLAVGRGTPPTLVSPPAPASQSVNAGTNVTYSLVASDAATYQWQKDGTPLPGATQASLLLAGVTAAAGGTYRVQAANAWGTTLSQPVLLSVLGDPLADRDGDRLPDGIELLLGTNAGSATTADPTNLTLQLKIIQP